jgi:hypothetical protein
MQRYQDEHVVVTLSDTGLHQAYGTSEIIQRLKDTEQLHKVLAVVASWGAAISLGFLIAYSACNGA